MLWLEPFWHRSATKPGQCVLASMAAPSAQPPDGGVHAEGGSPDGKVPMVVEPMPFWGRIYLDACAAQTYQLTDIVTCERRRLPAGVWSLEWTDDQSMCELCHTVGDEEHNYPIEAYLTKDVYVSGEGERFMVSYCDAKRRKSLDATLANYRSASVSIKMAESAARSDYQVYIMEVARHSGSRVYFALIDVYKALGMTSFNKTPSKWVHYIVPVSGRRLQQFFDDEGRFLWSRHMNVSPKKAKATPWYSRTLPHTCASALQLFIMVHAFAFLVAERGGLKDNSARKAAIGLFAAMVRKALSRSAKTAMTLELRDDWRCAWPRPSLVFDLPATHIDLRFGPGETINIEPFFDCGEACERRMWANALVKAGFHGDEQDVGVIELLGKIGRCNKLEPLLAQLLWRLASDFEVAIGEQYGHDEGDLQFTWKDPISHHDPDMEMKLFGYQQAARRESERHTTLGISSDKGNPAGLTLLNTTMTYGNGVMVLALPTVGALPAHRWPPRAWIRHGARGVCCSDSPDEGGLHSDPREGMCGCGTIFGHRGLRPN